jgi:hemerythrin superfamily protein
VQVKYQCAAGTWLECIEPLRFRAEDAMRATTLLKYDHAAVEKLLRRLGRTSRRAANTRQALIDKLATKLDVHGQIEEEIFYPALEREPSLQARLEESRHTHAVVQDLVTEVQRLAPGDERLGARVRQLRAVVLHHADEEEREMFPVAERSFDPQELEQLGQALRQRKQELAKGLGSRGGFLARMRRAFRRRMAQAA